LIGRGSISGWDRIFISLQNPDWLSRALQPPLMRLEFEANNSPSSNPEIKNAWSFSATSPFRLHVMDQTVTSTLPLKLLAFNFIFRVLVVDGIYVL
jgi:hypothetical protein